MRVLPLAGLLGIHHIHIVQRLARDLKGIYMQNVSHRLPGSPLSGLESPLLSICGGQSRPRSLAFRPGMLSEFWPSCMMSIEICVHRVNMHHSVSKCWLLYFGEFITIIFRRISPVGIALLFLDTTPPPN